MPDEHYENPKLAAIYDLFSGCSPDRDFYQSLAGAPPQTVLDLGCGTGDAAFEAAWAEGKQQTIDQAVAEVLALAESFAMRQSMGAEED